MSVSYVVNENQIQYHGSLQYATSLLCVTAAERVTMEAVALLVRMPEHFMLHMCAFSLDHIQNTLNLVKARSPQTPVRVANTKLVTAHLLAKVDALDTSGLQFVLNNGAGWRVVSLESIKSYAFANTDLSGHTLEIVYGN
jgi:hypothetical protein